MKSLGFGLVTLCGVLLLIFGLSLFGLGMDSFFAPKYRALENKTFKESEQYNDGMIRDLEDLKLEYVKSDDAHKQAIKGVILHRFSVYDINKLPYDLRSFYLDLKNE